MASEKLLKSRTAARGQGVNVYAETRLKWFGNAVARGVMDAIRPRAFFAGQYLQDKIKLNISIPVVKRTNPITGREEVVQRSKPGEYPRLETGKLRASIFHEVENITPMLINLIVGVPAEFGGESMEYGARLELSARLNRSFLLRTFNEERKALETIMGQPLTAEVRGGPKT